MSKSKNRPLTSHGKMKIIFFGDTLKYVGNYSHSFVEGLVAMDNTLTYRIAENNSMYFIFM